MKTELKQLKKITRDCREDMHEPDEQGISALVTGFHLDNAFGSDPYHNCGEFTVGIKKTDNNGDEEITWINLATLIALARKANLE